METITKTQLRDISDVVDRMDDYLKDGTVGSNTVSMPYEEHEGKVFVTFGKCCVKDCDSGAIKHSLCYRHWKEERDFLFGQPDDRRHEFIL